MDSEFGDVVSIFDELYSNKTMLSSLDRPELIELLAGIVKSHYINNRDEWDYTQDEYEMVMNSWRLFLELLEIKDSGDFQTLDEVMTSGEV